MTDPWGIRFFLRAFWGNVRFGWSAARREHKFRNHHVDRFPGLNDD